MSTDKVASAPTVLREISGPQRCSLCDAPGLKTELVRNPFICGVGAEAVELVANFPVHSCASCGRAYRGRDAGRIEHEAVCKHLRLPTPTHTREPVVIRQRGKESVAPIAADEISAWRETAYLLCSPRNAERLREAMARADAGEGEAADVNELRRRFDLTEE